MTLAADQGNRKGNCTIGLFVSLDERPQRNRAARVPDRRTATQPVCNVFRQSRVTDACANFDTAERGNGLPARLGSDIQRNTSIADASTYNVKASTTYSIGWLDRRGNT